ncbi:MAG: hypothetical protein LBR66_08055, partial [Candidatus Symbiothrix sp.]|nr:hypothetical protein [Candidatus Symbiothrix sp.]
MTAQAQLKVSDNGKVGVQIDSATPLSSLSVGYAGSTNHKLSTPLSSYRAWGVLGQAGNATSGYNYGVFG